MPSPRAHTQESIDVMTRFFNAVEALIAIKKIRGKATYCRIANIDRRHYYHQEKDISKGSFQISWALPLIKEFNVSSDWLLTGRGQMFKETKSSTLRLASSINR